MNPLNKIVTDMLSHDGVHAVLAIAGNQSACMAKRHDEQRDWDDLLGSVGRLTQMHHSGIAVRLPGRHIRIDADCTEGRVLVVAREANHPIRKSAPRMIRRSMAKLQAVMA